MTPTDIYSSLGPKWRQTQWQEQVKYNTMLKGLGLAKKPSQQRRGWKPESPRLKIQN